MAVVALVVAFRGHPTSELESQHGRREVIHLQHVAMGEAGAEVAEVQAEVEEEVAEVAAEGVVAEGEAEVVAEAEDEAEAEGEGEGEVAEAGSGVENESTAKTSSPRHGTSEQHRTAQSRQLRARSGSELQRVVATALWLATGQATGAMARQCRHHSKQRQTDTPCVSLSLELHACPPSAPLTTLESQRRCRSLSTAIDPSSCPRPSSARLACRHCTHPRISCINSQATGLVQMLPVALSGQDGIGVAQAGSGKTLAFLLPAIPVLLAARDTPTATPPSPRALVLAPTRELALQVWGVSRPLKRLFGLHTHVVTGGSSSEDQLDRLHKGVDLLVATPGRLVDLVQSGSVALGNVIYMVHLLAVVLLLCCCCCVCRWLLLYCH